MDKDRRTSFLILKDIETDDSWSNLAVNNNIAREGADNPAFIRELVYGVLRNQFRLDYNINRYLKKPGIGKSERLLLRMGFYQMAMMNSVPDHAAISETVKLADVFVNGKKPFVNAVLRSFQRDGGELLPDGNNDSVNYSFHPSIIKLWTKAYGKEKAIELIKSCNTVPPFTVRINPLRDDGSPVTFSIDSDDYRNGRFSVQDEASQMAVKMLAPKPGSTLIDVCAAPGGKSCAAAELMENRGKIFAFDLYEQRAGLIAKEAARLGIDIITAGQRDAEKSFDDLAQAADYVICDVPCSGLGVLRRKPEMKLRDISRELGELPGIQKNILKNASMALKHGGRILYSTCTVNPDENEAVSKWFLNNNPEFSIVCEKQLFPEEGGHDGFYICVMEKK